ncbi:hypothetical protein FJR41_009745 [Dolichospermum planctonicum UHCC 0167]|uniref:hypothetical protein n=1 Tax=Dolichospermum planctonicum TaxID=136072 RepID=UPI001442E8B6|nr:hypothetical protein [Dolichospermum planctonicum]MCW9681081.1 hypothetical protein [Dolichospermum planctonicum UHCC 0167]
MPLKIKDEISDIHYSLTEVIPNRNDEQLYFELSDVQNNIKIFIDYVLTLDSEYKPEDYSLFILKSWVLDKENDIFQVFDKEFYKEPNRVRLGWIFPIQALLSNEHQYADNKHFLKYAYVAFLKLLKNQEEYTTFNPLFSKITNNYKLTDFYGEDIIILILCNSPLQKIDNFQIDNYITSLYSYGYYFCQPIENLKEIDTRSDSENPTGKNLILQKNSSCLQKEDYVYRLFKDLLKNEEHHLVRFYLLYQVIELIIQIVFERKILEEIKNFNNNPDKNIRKLKEKIDNISTEKKRVSILINDDVKINNPNLLISCNELIKLFNDDDSNEKDDISKKEDLGGALYDVRCLIVHQFRKLPDKILEEKLREINKEFENIVIKIILDYK